MSKHFTVLALVAFSSQSIFQAQEHATEESIASEEHLQPNTPSYQSSSLLGSPESDAIEQLQTKEAQGQREDPQDFYQDFKSSIESHFSLTDALRQHSSGWTLLNQCKIQPRYFQALEVIKVPSHPEPVLAFATGRYKHSVTGLMTLNPMKCQFEEINSEPIDKSYFGEGMSYVPELDSFLQFTLDEKVFMRWQVNDRNEMVLADTWGMPARNEIEFGWGLAYVPESGLLLASDGTNRLKFVDVGKWEHEKAISVFKLNEDGEYKDELLHINEMEAIPGFPRYVIANVLFSTSLYLIDLETGHVAHEWDLLEFKQVQEDYVSSEVARLSDKLGEAEVTRLREERANETVSEQESWDLDMNLEKDPSDAAMFRKFDNFLWYKTQMNGVAYNPAHDSFLVTAKVWDFMWEVKLDYKARISQYEQDLA